MVPPAMFSAGRLVAGVLNVGLKILEESALKVPPVLTLIVRVLTTLPKAELPPDADTAAASVPPLTVTLPAKVLSPERICVPAPLLDRARPAVLLAMTPE
jgi:hypothetical protein